MKVNKNSSSSIYFILIKSFHINDVLLIMLTCQQVAPKIIIYIKQKQAKN